MFLRAAGVMLFIATAVGWTTPSAAVAQEQPQELVIIVNKANPVGSMTRTEVEKIYTADTSFWESIEPRQRILVLMREPGSPERIAALGAIYGMSEEQLKKFWLKKLLSGRAPNIPKDVPSTRLIKAAVASRRNAIGYVFRENVDDTVKIVAVAGQ